MMLGPMRLRGVLSIAFCIRPISASSSNAIRFRARCLQYRPLTPRLLHTSPVLCRGPSLSSDPPNGSRAPATELKHDTSNSSAGASEIKTRPVDPTSLQDPLLSDNPISTREQRKADWAIMKEMAQYLWPKDNLGTKVRVSLSLGLLIGAKVLNVQVPFYFKSIVDSMNVDFLAVGGTAWTVAGSMILACSSTPSDLLTHASSLLIPPFF